MAIRNLRYDTDEILKKRSKEIEVIDDKIKELAEDMMETMHKYDGVGLAAPQVGILKRIVVIDIGDGLLELINPEIIETSGEQIGEEGCLSVIGESGIVRRPNIVKVRAYNRKGQLFEIEGEELLARAFCHEIDHLDGILYVDKVEK